VEGEKELWGALTKAPVQKVKQPKERRNGDPQEPVAPKTVKETLI